MMRKLYSSILANSLNLAISIVVSLIVPKVMGIEQFSYWQLYIFYIGYIGFFHFGVVDGVYLRYGGKYYDELDKPLLHSQFWLLSILEFLMLAGFVATALLVIVDESKKIIIIATGLNCILILPRALLQFILQGTGRIHEFAKNFMIERLVYICLVVVFMLLGLRSFKYMIFADLIAKVIVLIDLLILCRDLVFARPVRLGNALSEFWQNIATGIKLLLANIAGLLIIGIVRFGIKRNWDIIMFGKVSFSLSISSFVLTFFNAISIVIFPMIKRSNQNKLPMVFETLGVMISAILIVGLIAYYPIQKLLLLWLPHYEEAIRYFAILFPTSIFEARTTLLNNTFLKALREEKAMLLLNGLTVCISLISTVIIIKLFDSLEYMIFSIVGLQVLKCVLTDFYLQYRMKMNPSYGIVWSIVATCVFIYGNWVISGLSGWGIYILFVLLMVVVRNHKYHDHIKRSITMLH